EESVTWSGREAERKTYIVAGGALTDGELTHLTARPPAPVPRCARSGGVGERARAALSREPALIDLVEERLVADAEQARGFGAVPVDLLEHFADRLALGIDGRLARDLLERARALLAGRGEHDPRCRRRDRLRRELLAQQVLALEHDDPLHHVLELADVAGPRVVAEQPKAVRTQRDLALELLVEALD